MNMVRLPKGGPRPPHSIEAEESVIGGVLVHQRAFEDVRFLPSDDFYHPALRAIFAAMVDLDELGLPIDTLTVAEQLRRRDSLDKLRAFNGADYLTELASKVVTVENIAYHARIVSEKANARRLVEACREIAARGYSDYGTLDDLVEAAEHAVAVVRNRSAPIDVGFPTKRVAAVPDLGPVQWLVRDIWKLEGVGIIGGEPKTYKSFLSAQIAVAVASGIPLFGRHEVQPGPVLMFNAEDDQPMTRDRIAQMCRALEVDFGSLPIEFVDVPALALDDPAEIRKLVRTVERLKPALTVLDPLRDLHSLDENDAKLASALLKPLRVMQREQHTAVMLVHHMSKLTETQRRPGQRLRGSSVYHGWVDSALYLSHKDGAILIEPEQRGAKALDKFTFTVENAHSPQGDALWLEAQVADEDGETARDREAIVDNSIISVLQEATEPLTSKDIRTRCKKRHEVIGEGIKRLVNQRLVSEEPVTRGRNNVPGYRLNR